jgi:hypothetical protein
METAMHVGVVMLVVVPERFDHGPRLLRGGGVIEINQRMSMHLLLQDREVRSDPIPVCDTPFMHEPMCASRRLAPSDCAPHPPDGAGLVNFVQDGERCQR